MVKAKYFYEIKCDQIKKSIFVVNNGWVNNFMCRNGFSLHRKDPERLINNFILYILHAPRLSIKYKYPPASIIAVEETSV